MKLNGFLFATLCMLNLSVLNVKSQVSSEAAPKSLNDTLVITTTSKELYICTCKPDTPNPNGEGKIYYQGRYIEDKVTEDADYHDCDERFLMQWDLTALPEGVKIIEARMKLVCAGYTGDKQGQLAYECIMEPWDANIGYSKKPKTLPEYRILSDWPVKNTYYIVDITSFVSLWYNGAIKNYGLMGFSINTETTNSALFCSSRFPKDDLRPRLTIIYTNE